MTVPPIVVLATYFSNELTDQYHFGPARIALSCTGSIRWSQLHTTVYKRYEHQYQAALQQTLALDMPFSRWQNHQQRALKQAVFARPAAVRNAARLLYARHGLTILNLEEHGTLLCQGRDSYHPPRLVDAFIPNPKRGLYPHSYRACWQSVDQAALLSQGRRLARHLSPYGSVSITLGSAHERLRVDRYAPTLRALCSLFSPDLPIRLVRFGAHWALVDDTDQWFVVAGCSSARPQIGCSSAPILQGVV